MEVKNDNAGVNPDAESKEKEPISDRVAVWEVPLHSGMTSIEFEHGTTSGRRIIRVDGKEILRRDWMFKLVGPEEFTIGKNKCKINVDPYGLFSYCYSLEVNGKAFKEFRERQSKILKTWTVRTVDGSEVRIVLEKQTLDIWVNGSKVDVESEFVDGGTKTYFEAANHPATLHAFNTGIKKSPIIYSLTFNGEEIVEAQE